MSLATWVLVYAVSMLFWLWVARWGGAERLEDTFISGFLIHLFAPRWSAEGIRLFGYGMIVTSSTFFVIGLFIPEARDFLLGWI